MLLRIECLNYIGGCWCVHTEKEEQKRTRRLAKEQLGVLKVDDEEAYMKLQKICISHICSSR